MRPASSVRSASTAHPAPTVRHVLLAVALSLGVAVMLVSAAGEQAQAQDERGPWPQWTGDADHTRQADGPGPDDPGLAWWVDVESLTPPDDSARPSDEPYESLERWPSLSPVGDVLVRAVHPDDESTLSTQGRLLALDRDDGSVLWEVADIRSDCGQAADSQGRIWVTRWDDGGLQAVDPATGEPLAGTPPGADTFECSRDPNHLQVGGDPEHLVVVGGARGATANGLAAYDISGDDPQEQWRLTEDGAEIEGLLESAARGSEHRQQQVLITDDAVYAAVEVAGEDGEDPPNRPELVEIDLDSGDVTARVTIPVHLGDADHDEPRADDIRAVSFLRTGDTLVLGVEANRLSDAAGLLAGVDLATGLDEIAWQTATGVDGEFTRGPLGLTLTDETVALRDADAGFEPVRGFDPATGERQWTGEIAHPFPATGGDGGWAADADGALYAHGPGGQVDVDDSVLLRTDANGRGAWYLPKPRLEQEMGLDDGDLFRDLVLGPADEDFLVVTEDAGGTSNLVEGAVIALDDSGGLAEPWPDEPDDADVPDERIGAANRIATSVELSQQFASADTVLLATAEAYPDSLAGAPLASQLGAPILLTVPDGVSAPVVEELHRLEPDRAVLLGGEGALGPGVEDGLRAQGIDDIERFDGANRFQTAAQIAIEVRQRTEGDTGRAYVVEGAHADPARGWPDAVGVSALAAAEGTPILLVTHGDVPRATVQTAELFSDFTIIGGHGAVSEEVADFFRGLDEMSEEDDVTVERVAGTDRFDTSAQVSDRAVAAGVDPTVVYLATGGDWPDSLSAAPVAGATAADLSIRSGVLLLVDGRDLSFSPSSADWLENRASDIDSVTAVGGSAAISDDVLTEAQALVE